jgi:hypothetical protein
MDLEHDVPDLRNYLAQRQQAPATSAGATNGAGSGGWMPNPRIDNRAARYRRTFLLAALRGIEPDQPRRAACTIPSPTEVARAPRRRSE